MYRKTYLEVNLDNIYHNLDVIKSSTNKKILAVVKANAYGAVDYYIAEKLENKGVDGFGVSSLDEALRLRNHGIKSMILVMGYTEEFDVVKANDISIITPNFEFVEKYAKDLKGVRVELKIDTGLNRLGVMPDKAKEALDLLLNNGAIVEGALTHIACADDQDYTYSQYYLFKDTIEKLNYDFKYLSVSASDAALYLDDEISNYVRIGIALYGNTNIESNLDLKPVISLYAEVVSSKIVLEGDGVSYGHKYIADGKSYINTIAIGYADGISKRLQDQEVTIGDEEGKIVGTICMDLMMVKSKHKHECHELVEIYGAHHSIKDRAESLDTNICSILCALSERLPRVYIENGKVVNEINSRN